MSPSRIDELRRRVQNDPASIAFAQLAEEYRRSGQTDDAVRICREGLVRHPGYLSARVTLGRALLDLGELAEARGEFEFVVAEAPENLAAVRGLAEIFHRDGQMAEALTYYERALALARHDPEIEEIVQQLSRQIGMAASGPPGGLSFEEAHQELLSAAERVPLAPQSASPPPARNAAEGSTAPFDFDRLVAALGTPSAPPQLEAVVQGLAAPVIDLPDPVDLGPNPFAALEAELRAHGAPAGETAAAWGLEPAMTATDTAAAQPAAGVAEVADHEVDAQSAGALTAAAVPALDDPERPTDVGATVPPLAPGALSEDAQGEEAAAFSGSSHPDELAAFVATPEEAERGAEAESEGDAGAVAVTDTRSLDTAPLETPAAGDDTVAAEQRPEDVLGDLETWLNTLHDRSTE
ncbi:MAG: tetratricopeptide repeat protein [Acidobacteria bacterium]|nr:tetratricopeptide repeat protein [Acidobacteriota bacterium]